MQAVVLLNTVLTALTEWQFGRMLNVLIAELLTAVSVTHELTWWNDVRGWTVFAFRYGSISATIFFASLFRALHRGRFRAHFLMLFVVMLLLVFDNYLAQEDLWRRQLHTRFQLHFEKLLVKSFEHFSNAFFRFERGEDMPISVNHLKQSV